MVPSKISGPDDRDALLTFDDFLSSHLESSECITGSEVSSSPSEMLEKLLKKSGLLEYKGGVIDGDYHRNMLAGIIANSSVFSLKTVEEETVLKIINNFKTNSQGFDEITLDMIILTLPRTLSVITRLVNRSIQTGTFPDVWKEAKVIPLPKINNPKDLKDLRPISILPFMSKILEKVYVKWVTAIKALFPGERTATYYIPAYTTVNGTVHQARGKLVSQVANKRRRLQKMGALKKKSKRKNKMQSKGSKKAVGFAQIACANDTLQPVIKDLEWLQNFSGPWSMVLKKWKDTRKERIRMITDEKQCIKSYFDQYPALKNANGHMLLTSDFEGTYHEWTNNLITHFPILKIKLLDLLKTRKHKDPLCQDTLALADSSDEEKTNLAAFFSIAYLLNTSYGFRKLKKKKLSKVEARDSFIKHLKNEAELEQFIELHDMFEPLIFIVGNTLFDIEKFLVVANQNVMYEVGNIIQAVDTCYKIKWALNTEYASHCIWYFIQKAFYKMKTSDDTESSVAESLLSDCNL